MWLNWLLLGNLFLCRAMLKQILHRQVSVIDMICYIILLSVVQVVFFMLVRWVRAATGQLCQDGRHRPDNTGIRTVAWEQLRESGDMRATAWELWRESGGLRVTAWERRPENNGVRAAAWERKAAGCQRCMRDYVKFLFLFLTVSVFLFSANLKRWKFAKFFCAENFICNNISSEMVMSKSIGMRAAAWEGQCESSGLRGAAWEGWPESGDMRMKAWEQRRENNGMRATACERWCESGCWTITVLISVVVFYHVGFVVVLALWHHDGNARVLSSW